MSYGATASEADGRSKVARRMAAPLSPLRLLSPLGPLTDTQTPIRLAAYRRFPDVYP
jgi:hypothetical protein